MSETYKPVEEHPQLFDIDPDWKKEWEGMPEFVQGKQEEHACINIRFRNEDDLQAFAQLIGQKINCETKSLWFPKREPSMVKKVYK